MDHVAEIQILKQRIVKLERDLALEEEIGTHAIEERDSFEEFVTDLATGLLGCDREWSNMHDHCECIKESVGYLQADCDQMREVLKTIAAWPFDIMIDCVAEARRLAREALGRYKME